MLADSVAASNIAPLVAISIASWSRYGRSTRLATCADLSLSDSEPAEAHSASGRRASGSVCGTSRVALKCRTPLRHNGLLLDSDGRAHHTSTRSGERGCPEYTTVSV